MRCMAACATGTHLGTRSAHSGSNSCKDSNLDWYSTVAAGLRLEPSVFQKHFPAAALHLSVWTFSLYGVSLSFNHAPLWGNWGELQQSFVWWRIKHTGAHTYTPKGASLRPTCRRHNNSTQQGSHHKLALTWPKGCWEILSSFLHFCFLVSIHFQQLWLSVMSWFHTLSGSAAERVREEV